MVRPDNIGMLVMETLDEARHRGESREKGLTVQAVRRFLPEDLRQIPSVEKAAHDLFQWNADREERHAGIAQDVQGVFRGSLTQMATVLSLLPHGHPARDFAVKMRILNGQWRRREEAASESFAPYSTEELLQRFDGGTAQLFEGWNVHTDERIRTGVIARTKGSDDVRAGVYVCGQGFVDPSFLLREASTGSTFEHEEWWMRM